MPSRLLECPLQISYGSNCTNKKARTGIDRDLALHKTNQTSLPTASNFWVVVGPNQELRN